jgi:hypothetical protein
MAREARRQHAVAASEASPGTLTRVAERAAKKAYVVAGQHELLSKIEFNKSVSFRLTLTQAYYRRCCWRHQLPGSCVDRYDVVVVGK